MTFVICNSCSKRWDPARDPACPQCTLESWKSEPNLVRPKHDPRKLPRAEGQFRTVVSFAFVRDTAAFLQHAIENGNWFISNRHQGKPCHFTPGPVQDFAGSGIPAGESMPSWGMDGLLIADPVHNPHVMADDEPNFEAEYSEGQFSSLPICSEHCCDHIAYPGERLCVVHRSEPLASTAAGGSPTQRDESPDE